MRKKRLKKIAIARLHVFFYRFTYWIYCI